MNKYESLRQAASEALRKGDTTGRMTINDIINSIDKLSMEGKTRKEITDELVDTALTKYVKMIKESIETCPDTENYSKRKAQLRQQLAIAEQYAPKVVTDPNEIRAILEAQVQTAGRKFSNMGELMKFAKSAGCDGKATQSVAKEFI